MFSRHVSSLDIPEHVQRELQRKVEAGVRAAFVDGKDFVHEPVEFVGPEPFGPLPLWEPQRYAIQCKGGAVPAGLDWPSDYTVYRVSSISEGERARLAAGRDDWRDSDWEDECGLPDCEHCNGGGR